MGTGSAMLHCLKDPLVLLNAEEEILAAKNAPDDDGPDPQAFYFLQTISRKIENFDNKLQVLGVTVTTNVRNGWLAAMVTLAGKAFTELLKPVIADIHIEDVEALIEGEITFS